MLRSTSQGRASGADRMSIPRLPLTRRVVSQAALCRVSPSSWWRRLSLLSGTGSAATIAWSLDYTMFDPQNFAIDEHGIATDGTYLHRTQWRGFNPNTKV